MEQICSVLNNPVGAADVVVVDGVLTITGGPSIHLNHLCGFERTPSVAEVLQISTVTFTFANNTLYRFFLKQDVDGIEKSLIFNFTSDSNATAAEINAAFTATVLALGFKITPSGAGSPLTLTAQAGYPIFTISAVENVTVATGTPGVAAVGTYADVLEHLEDCHNNGTALPLSGNVYTAYDICYMVPTTPAFCIIDRNVMVEYTLFVNEGDAQYDAFDAELVEVMYSVENQFALLPTQDQKDAMDNANDPDAANPFATINDAGGTPEVDYFYQTVAQVTGTIAANNGKALFATSSANNTGGLTTVALSGDITVGAGAAGLYQITWNVSAAEAGAMALFIGAAIQAGTTYGSGAGTQQNTGFAILELAVADVVSLRTDNAPAALTLQLAGTTNTGQIVTSILFERISV